MIQVPIIHLHIPKAAGTTLTSLFKRCFSNDEVFLCGDNELGLNHFQSNVHFTGLDDDEKRKYKFIAGHVEFPLIESYPGRHFSFTFLRNPVSRLNSLYYYVKENSNHHMHSHVVKKDLSLRGFCELGLWHEVDNGMCRRLSGVVNDVPYGECDETVLDLAKENLKNNISFVGIHERFDESLFLLLFFLDALELLEYERKNTTGIKRSVAEMVSEDRIAVNSYNQYDLELYSFARELYATKYHEVKIALHKPLNHYLSKISLTNL